MAENWLADVRKYATDADERVVDAIVKYCGISLQSRDSSLVAMADPAERDLIRENYLKEKLGLVHPDEDLDAAVVTVGQRMKDDRTKNRVTVYYLLAEHFGLLSLFDGATSTTGAAEAVPLAAAGFNDSPRVSAATTSAPEPVPAPASLTVKPPSLTPSESADAYALYDADDHSGGFGWWKWLLLAAAIFLLLFVAIRYWSDREASEPVLVPASEADAGQTAAASGDIANTAVAGSAATGSSVPVPQGAGVVAGEIGGRPRLIVYFETGKSAVINDIAAASATLKDYVANNPAARIAVSGYNDPSGDAALNAELSKQRAQRVAKALEIAGISAASINMEKPAATTDAAVSAAEARRVEVVVKP